MIFCRTSALALLVLAACTAFSEAAAAPIKLKSSPNLAVASAEKWREVYKGAEFRKMTLERSDPSHSIALKLFRFDSRLIIPRVMYSVQHNLRVADVKTIAEKTGAIAAINANYFDPEGKPLAFLKTARKTINPKISQSALYTGVFGIKNHTPFIMHRNDFLPEDADEGIQSGPLLLLRGSPQTITGVPSRPSRRALIGIDREQRLIMAATDTVLGGLTWAELQEIFTASLWQLEAAELLAMDGGGSAQIYFRSSTFEELVAGTSVVPVMIGFFAK